MFLIPKATPSIPIAPGRLSCQSSGKMYLQRKKAKRAGINPLCTSAIAKRSPVLAGPGVTAMTA
jgi:hypothetical protein